jgi:hypothetical protein
MSLTSFIEYLRAPDGVGSGGGAPVVVAEPALTVALAGPLTVDPAPQAADAAPVAAEPVAAAAPVAEPAAAPAPAAAAQPVLESELSLISGAKGKDALKAAPLAVDLPAPADGAPVSTADPAAAAEPVGAAPADKAKVEPQPLAAKQYAAFKIPAGVTATEEGIKEFTDILNSDPAARVSQETAQKLFDKHVSEVQRAVAEARKEPRDYWRKLIDGWKTELRNDRRIGGSRLETSLLTARRLIERYAATQQDADGIFALLTANGMGNFLPFVRLLERIGSPSVLNVIEDSIVPATAPTSSAALSRAAKWYQDSQPKGAP